MHLLDIFDFFDKHLLIFFISVPILMTLSCFLFFLILMKYADKQGRAIKFLWISVGAKNVPAPQGNLTNPPAQYPTEFCLGIHHVSLPVKNLTVSKQFYQGTLKLTEIKRDPAFNRLFRGAWYQLPCGQQIHLIVDKTAVFRERNLKFGGKVPPPIHFAITLSSRNYISIRNEILQNEKVSSAEKLYPVKIGQLYILDPSNHIIELTDAGSGE